MKMAAKNVDEIKVVETFDTLTEKHSIISTEMADVEQELKQAQDALSNAKSLNKQVRVVILQKF